MEIKTCIQPKDMQENYKKKRLLLYKINKVKNFTARLCNRKII